MLIFGVEIEEWLDINVVSEILWKSTITNILEKCWTEKHCQHSTKSFKDSKHIEKTLHKEEESKKQGLQVANITSRNNSVEESTAVNTASTGLKVKAKLYC